MSREVQQGSSSGPSLLPHLGLRVYMSTYGCQMNVNDTERMLCLLEMANCRQVSDPKQADLIVINTCSVREKPVHKVFSEVGRYRPLKQLHPKLKIGVAGCVAQQEKQKLMQAQPLIDFVLGTDNIDELASIVDELIRGEKKKATSTKFYHRAPFLQETMIRKTGVTAFVNITKGCDNFCTFCVVPFTRGREKSRPVKHLVDDISHLVKRGVKEVTLLGQNVNSYYSKADDCNFARLIARIAEDTGVQRIRYTTSHPKDFNQELVDISQKYRTKVCDYVHFPVQSGDSTVLKRMNRGYTRQEYLDKVEMIKQGIPGVSLSTDIIVGFPGETRGQFEKTLSLVGAVGYESIFAFQYSPRPFTKATKFEDQIPEKEKSLRLQELLDYHNQRAFDLCKKYEGLTLDVLVESWDEDRKVASGRSTQNKLTHFQVGEGVDPLSLVGHTVPVLIHKAFPINLKGKLVEERQA